MSTSEALHERYSANDKQVVHEVTCGMIVTDHEAILFMEKTAVSRF